MEQNMKYKCDYIPVIFFNFDSEQWEAKNEEMEQSHLAAMYKNQLNRAESRKAANSSSLYESRSMRRSPNEGRAKKRASLFPKGFSLIILLAVVLFGIWLWVI